MSPRHRSTPQRNERFFRCLKTLGEDSESQSVSSLIIPRCWRAWLIGVSSFTRAGSQNVPLLRMYFSILSTPTREPYWGVYHPHTEPAQSIERPSCL